ncbi:hypothetical protein PDM24_11645 [Bacteroides fragilis]|uniref:hypothetical protein n=1 Tax=Bacteroides fragilis TaxID=817 RepID=UPI0022AA3F85|nr:hypothetical protein [Bacteroides fragilis]MCE8600197.1 hypothetical protein [Bacteroides fragilis]MCE8680097.1 hypothetical protein [Bacteroides fragilis]MCS2422561.1 hypothetical protein [Bacteroides fragilis]MCZ2543960.1 hypothetical protein [Bacteroides fragilis]MDA1471532.1 hypothetical protein [Bacteroides fragilis]
MKHHVHLIIYFACISVGILLCACRSSSLHSNQFKENGTFQHNYNELNTGTGTIASQVKTTKDEHSSSWKITYHFDTAQTPDPTTGLPPLSGIEIEGSEKQSKTAQESNDTVHSSNSSSKREISGQTIQRESGTETKKDSKVATGTDDGIRNGLSIGIPLLFIIIALSYYAKRQNTSK